MIYKSYMYSLTGFHKLNILCIQHPGQKGGYSWHPSDLCAKLRSRAQALHYGGGGGGEHIFSKAAHLSALGSSEPLHLSAALGSERPPAGIQSPEGSELHSLPQQVPVSGGTRDMPHRTTDPMACPLLLAQQTLI